MSRQGEIASESEEVAVIPITVANALDDLDCMIEASSLPVLIGKTAWAMRPSRRDRFHSANSKMLDIDLSQKDHRRTFHTQILHDILEVWAMKIVVINGTEKRGVTHRLKEMFLNEFGDRAGITEYYLPRDCPSFCMGCTNCISKGEKTCKDAERIGKIERSILEADLIVMTSPAYVFHATGAMKALLDHLAYRWMPHRPAPEMFGKRAVIITQCLGSGAKSAAKDIKHSLSWWGISKIGIFTGALMSDIAWDKLPQKKQSALIGKIKRLARRFARMDYAKGAHTNPITKVKFILCRCMQKHLRQLGVEHLDGKYWTEQGWLDGARPWK